MCKIDSAFEVEANETTTTKADKLAINLCKYNMVLFNQTNDLAFF
jgi:hypothetical protein